MAKTPDAALRAGETAAVGVRRIIDALLGQAIARIRHPSRDRAEDIHVVRTTIKRLRAILRMIRPVIGDAAFQRQNAPWKKAARRLGVARDLTVGGQWLERLSNAASSKSSLRAFSLVQDGYGKRLTPLPPRRRDQAMRAVAAILQASRLHFRRLHLEADDWAIIGPGLEKVYRHCHRRWKKAMAKGGDEAFHRWRIRVKNLQYELQTLLAVWPKRLARMLRQLKVLQDRIGSDHDLTVLRVTLQAEPDQFGGKTAVKIVLRDLQKRSRKLRRATRPLGARLFDEKPGDFIRGFEQHWTKWTKTTQPAVTPSVGTSGA